MMTEIFVFTGVDLPPELYVKVNRRSLETDDRFVEDYRRLAIEFANTINPSKMTKSLFWKERVLMVGR